LEWGLVRGVRCGGEDLSSGEVLYGRGRLAGLVDEEDGAESPPVWSPLAVLETSVATRLGLRGATLLSRSTGTDPKPALSGWTLTVKVIDTAVPG
jgi:hypothetical protein